MTKKMMNTESNGERSTLRNVLEAVLGVGDAGQSEWTPATSDRAPRFFHRRDGA